jgi:ferric-dicitrate binding protein FerR (iron transport regulator)
MKVTKSEFQVLMDKYLNGLATPEERKLLDQFFDSYKMTSGKLNEFPTEIKDEVFQVIQARISRKSGRRTSGVFTSQWFRVAAVISFALITSFILFYQFGSKAETPQPQIAKMKEVSVTKGQKLDLRLPDGSRVRLNSNSKITYPEKFNGEIREVTLEGEAYFEVAHINARPFIVHTSDASTKVLGTSFNVSAIGETTEITLVEGKVNVSLPGGPSVTLTPKLQATIARGSQHIDTHEVDVEKYVGWKDNTLYFNNTTVREAFNIMENWYNVEIDATNPKLLNCIITSKYENESLENVLNSFRFMLKTDFKINGQQVTVSGNGCN